MAVTVERLVADIEADPAAAIAALRALEMQLDAASRDRTSNLRVHVDDADVDRSAESAHRATGAFRGFRMVLMGLAGTGIYAALTALPGLLSAIGAAAGGAVGAIGPLVGLLGALPVGIAGLVGGMMTLGLGLSGVMKGYQATMAVQKQSAASTVMMTGRQRELAAAYRGLREAQIGVVRAERELRDARKNMREAPAEAAEAISDAHLEARSAILSERAAILALQEAQRNLSNLQDDAADSTKKVTQQTDEFTGKVYDVAKASEDSTTTASDMAQAQLAVEQAELAVAQAKDANSDAQKNLNELTAKGIKGSDIYISAQDRLVDAQFGIIRAHDAVAAAKERIQEAQERLRKGTGDLTAANRNLADAMNKLSPAGRRFVTFLQKEFMPAFDYVRKQAQEGLLPGVQSGLSRLIPLQRRIGKGFFEMGRAIGGSFDRMMKFWTQDKNADEFGRMWAGLIRVVRAFGDMMIPLSAVFVKVIRAGTPLLTMLLNGFAGWLDKINAKLGTKSGFSKLEGFFSRSYVWMQRWGAVLSPLMGVLAGVTKAAAPLARWMLKSMADYFEKLNRRINSVTGQKKLKKWFEDQKPAIRETVGFLKDLVNILFTSGKGGEKSGFVKTMKTLRKEWLPALSRLMTTLDKSDFGSKFATFLKHVTDGLTALVEHDGAFSIFIDGINGIAEALSKLSKVTGGKSTDVLMGLMLGAAGLKMAGGIVGGVAGKKTKGKGGRKGGLAQKVVGTKNKKGVRKGGVLRIAGQWVKAAAIVVGKAGVIIGSWVAMAAAATAQGLRIAAAWGFAVLVPAAKAAATSVKSAAVIVGSWVMMGLRSTAYGAMMAAAWVFAVFLPAVAAIPAMIATRVVIIASWVMMAVQAMASAARMAAAWVIALGPIAWVTIAVIAIAALIALKWDWIKEKTEWLVDRIKKGFRDWLDDMVKVKDAVTNFGKNLWDGFMDGLIFALNWSIDRLNDLIKLINQIPHVPDIGLMDHVGTGQNSRNPGDKTTPGRQFGGSVMKDEPYIVGEKRAELFVPSTSGRIMPTVNPGVGMDQGEVDARFERLIKVLEDRDDKKVEINQTFNEKIDPKHVSNELAWSLR